MLTTLNHHMSFVKTQKIMTFNPSLINLLQTNTVTRYLTAGERNRYIQDLQITLFDLGFGEELGWSRHQTDGFYSGNTIKAVSNFSSKNGFDGSGLSVSAPLLIKMWERYEMLDDLRILLTATSNRTLGNTYNLHNPGSFQNQSLQIIMNALGYANVSLNTAIRDFGRKNGIPADGFSLTRQLALKIIDNVAAFFGKGVLLGYDLSMTNSNNGSHTNPVGPSPDPITTDPAPNRPLQYRDEGSKLLVTNGVVPVRLNKHNPNGYSFWGTETIEDYIQKNRMKLQQLGVTDSSVNVMRAVSENEGRLDAINNYDRGFLSFGIYQWTIGTDNRAGELPALLKKVKSIYPNTFRKYFSTHGLDISHNTNPSTGYLTLNGTTIDTPREKEQFRDPKWAYYFVLAGRDENVQAVEIEHALGRLKNFYWKDSHAINGFTLSQIITSEYGVALILDNHVNRPAFVQPCIQIAMQQTGLQNPSFWSTNDELNVLNAYLKVRKTYRSASAGPMTKADERAAVTQKYLNASIISLERGSFQYENVSIAGRSLGNNNAQFVNPPESYEATDYPDITPIEDL